MKYSAEIPSSLNDAMRKLELADEEIERLRAALQPFANFAEKAEQFVEARAADNCSPILPSKDFRLADFQRARDALARQRGKDAT